MKYAQKTKALLVLQDGTVYYGNSAGKIGTATGELAFNTGMTGYQEIFTDPSYFGQVMLTTNAHIGNYGVHKDETDSSSIKISALVCKNFSIPYSRTSADRSIQKYFEDENIVGICDVDTRALVRHIRSKGAMNAIISSEILDPEELKKKLNVVPSMDGLELASKVSTKEAYFYGKEDATYRIAVLDLGIKTNILRCFDERDCYLKVFPHNTSHEEMLAWNPDGIFLSNGPGDPSAMPEVIKEVKKIIAGNLPVFGICLGHQMIGLSLGLTTFKMHNGHRGINHPIKNLETGKGEITSQNHGFCVNMDEAKAHPDVVVTHQHLNDGTLAGLRMKSKKVFSVQYHPESSPGPHDSRYLFDQFVKNLSSVKKQQLV